jgi:hypothetical protein
MLAVTSSIMHLQPCQLFDPSILTCNLSADDDDDDDDDNGDAEDGDGDDVENDDVENDETNGKSSRRISRQRYELYPDIHSPNSNQVRFRILTMTITPLST